MSCYAHILLLSNTIHIIVPIIPIPPTTVNTTPNMYILFPLSWKYLDFYLILNSIFANLTISPIFKGVTSSSFIFLSFKYVPFKLSSSFIKKLLPTLIILAWILHLDFLCIHLPSLSFVLLKNHPYQLRIVSLDIHLS